MVENSTGLILRTRPLTETSLIIHWLTPQLGRLTTVAKGARRFRSPFRGKLDLFYYAEFSFNRSQRSELHNLREVKLIETHPVLRQDLGYLQQAAYCTGLIEQTTEIETPIGTIFELLRGLLAFLPRRPLQRQTIFAFELKLLRELGLQPDLAQTKLSGGTRELVRALTEGDWEMASRIRSSGAQSAELRNFLHGFLIFHLGRLPKGRESALQGSRQTE
jgi:DNA repair protein RecO (recombination protein O)